MTDPCCTYHSTGSAADASPLALLDGMATFVAGMTGVKQQLIDAGWSAEAAEKIVFEIVRKTPIEPAVSP